MGTPRQSTFPIAPFALSLEDAGAYIAVSPRQIEDLIRARKLASVKIGARRVVRRIDLERLLNAQVEDHYIFRAPETIREAMVADTELKALADALRAQARRARDPVVIDHLLLAVRAYTQLAQFYRWNAGLGEFAPDEDDERIPA
jgi:hypothetical protein